MPLVREAMAEDPDLSMYQAVHRVGPLVDAGESRGWVKQARVDAGESRGTTTGDPARIKALEAENRELKRANEILLAASSYVGDRCQARVSSRFGEQGVVDVASSSWAWTVRGGRWW